MFKVGDIISRVGSLSYPITVELVAKVRTNSWTWKYKNTNTIFGPHMFHPKAWEVVKPAKKKRYL